MSGATDPHSRICSNIHFHTRLRLAGRDCVVHQAEMKVGAAQRRGFAYPDIAMVRGKGQFFDAVQDVLMNPSVIFEVLSDSTRAFDLTNKLVEYQKLDSLRHYVAVEQKSRILYHWSRGTAEKWGYETLDAPAAVLALTALKIALPLAEIYERIARPTKRRKTASSQTKAPAPTLPAPAEPSPP